ncbi:MAG TPA: hypothetical protein VMR62_26530 [Bryobacteraceae bacterium]|jgi:hypothetical protein|nr:hypothetical protein [Bryobacteraceae bacterium]
MRISLTLEVSGDAPAWCRFMPEDLVDRILRKRKQHDSAKELQDRLNVDRIATVEENADWLWGQITERIRHLIGKYNKNVSENGRFDINPPKDDPAASERIEVNHPAFPIAKLMVWRASNHFLQFKWERIADSFTRAHEGEGRICYRAVDRERIEMTTDGAIPVNTPQAAAEHLLEWILDDDLESA